MGFWFWHIVKAKRKGYHARNAKPLIGGWLQLFMQMCKIFNFSLFPGTVHLLLRIILESFKLHYFFLTSITCDEYFALRTQIRSDAWSCQTIANLDARDFLCAVSGFGQFFIVSNVPSYFCLAPSQNSNVWRPNIHVWTHFEPISSLRVHGWIQKTVSQLVGARGCRRKRQLSFLYNVFILM